MSDAKYFGTTKKGEIFELREDLCSGKEDKKKEAVKKVIAAMTVGKDVSSLFTEVLNCIQTNNVELKKLVYLYVMNYAKSHPDRAILAVNTFIKDTEDINPLIRALAIRTMGCIRVEKITEYLCEPLRKCLSDQDPYVLKTAAICVAKLYDINPAMVEDQGFIEQLKELLTNSNHMVVANAVAALSEIDDLSPKSIWSIDKPTSQKLLASMEECSEWGQIFILNSLAKYEPKDSKQAENICLQVTSRFQHANSAIVLAAVRVVMQYMNYIKSEDFVGNLCIKLGPPLVTLLQKQMPEIQYVALRNINLILQKRPSVLASEIRVFFCKYNDPIYVKMEKLEIMTMLANDKNIDQVLLEFKEYTSEVDVEFVRKSVRAIGRCAIKLEKAAEKCVHVIIDIIKTKIDYVVQESVVVIKDIFRRYPNSYESVISLLCDNLKKLDEPEAKASMIWIIGEYAEAIDQADELLDHFLETFKDEAPQVQLQLLTAIVKLFLKRPKTTQNMVQEVLNLATKETDNPDLRDRGYVYWRLLFHQPEAAKQIVLAQKPLISDKSERIDPVILDELIANISTLASVYYKPPETFVPKLKGVDKKKLLAQRRQEAEDEEEEDTREYQRNGSNNNSFSDMLGLSDGGSSSPTGSSNNSYLRNEVQLLTPDKADGIELRGGFMRQNGQITLELTLTNHTQKALPQPALQFNKNYFKLTPGVQNLSVSTVAPGKSVSVSHPIVHKIEQEPFNGIVKAAIKLGQPIYYFDIPVQTYVTFVEKSGIDKDAFLNLWSKFTNERFLDVQLFTSNLKQLQARLEAFNLVIIANRDGTDGWTNMLYIAAKQVDGAVNLFELAINGTKCNLCTRSSADTWAIPAEKSLAFILSGGNNAQPTSTTPSVNPMDFFL